MRETGVTGICIPHARSNELLMPAMPAQVQVRAILPAGSGPLLEIMDPGEGYFPELESKVSHCHMGPGRVKSCPHCYMDLAAGREQAVSRNC